MGSFLICVVYCCIMLYLVRQKFQDSWDFPSKHSTKKSWNVMGQNVQFGSPTLSSSFRGGALSKLGFPKPTIPPEQSYDSYEAVG